MEFRRHGQSDGRRRRVILDEVLATGSPEGTEPGDAPKKGKSSHKPYSDRALEANQPRITCVLPVRWYSITVTLLVLLTLITGIVALNVRLTLATPGGLSPTLRAFDVSAAGSLADWLASTLLLLSSLTALIVLSVRRHRLDDYRGRYRLWGWVALACLLGSIDATTGLHTTFNAWLATVLRLPVQGVDRGLWMGVYLLVGSWGLVRFIHETVRSRLARCFLLWTALGYGGAAALTFAPLEDSLLLSIGRCLASLNGHLGLFATLLAFARFVHLEAQGQLKRGKRRAPAARRTTGEETKAPAKGEGKTTATAKAGGKQLRVDAAHPVPAPAAVPTITRSPATATAAAAAPAAATSAASTADSADKSAESAAPRLSKAERRKLRR